MLWGCTALLTHSCLRTTPCHGQPHTTIPHALCTLQAERQANVTAWLRRKGLAADENDLERFESYISSGTGNAADLVMGLVHQRRGERQEQVRAVAMTVAVARCVHLGAAFATQQADRNLQCMVSRIA